MTFDPYYVDGRYERELKQIEGGKWPMGEVLPMKRVIGEPIGDGFYKPSQIHTALLMKRGSGYIIRNYSTDEKFISMYPSAEAVLDDHWHID